MGRRWSTRTKALCGGAVVAACGALYYGYARRSNAAVAEKIPSLTGDQFNAMQDQKMLRTALRKNHMPWTYHQLKTKNAAAAAEALRNLQGDDYLLTFYRLLGCPYCAKVDAVLRFYNVPFDSAYIDPLNGNGLPDKRYELAPQLFFSPSSSLKSSATATAAADQCSGVFLVDSSTIVAELAEPLGFAKDIKDERVSGTREWITSHFQGASFALTNCTLRNAYVSFPLVTPEYYHGFLYRVVGSVALYTLATLKIKPSVTNKVHPFNEQYQQQQQDRAGAAAPASKPAHSADAWLRDELAVFTSRVPPASTFHGGAVPDLADIEMYGVTRIVHQHPSLRSITEEGKFGEWQRAMETFIIKRNGGL